MPTNPRVCACVRERVYMLRSEPAEPFRLSHFCTSHATSVHLDQEFSAHETYRRTLYHWSPS